MDNGSKWNNPKVKFKQSNLENKKKELESIYIYETNHQNNLIVQTVIKIIMETENCKRINSDQDRRLSFFYYCY